MGAALQPVAPGDTGVKRLDVAGAEHLFAAHAHWWLIVYVGFIAAWLACAGGNGANLWRGLGRLRIIGRDHSVL